MPIYIATVLHLHRNNIVIKKGSSEQKLSPDLLNMINDAPAGYSVVLENWNEEKSAYMAQLEQLFQKHIHEQEKVYNSFAYIVSAMGRWYMSLPKYAKEMTKSYKGIGAKDAFYDWDSPNGESGPQDGLSDHTGIVEKVENGIVYTIEGNSGNSCRERQHTVGYYEILGYGIPAY